MYFYTNDSERMRIDSSGRVKINSTAGYKLNVEDSASFLFYGATDATTGSVFRLRSNNKAVTIVDINAAGNSTFYGDIIIEDSLPIITLKSTDNTAVAEDIVSSIDFYAGDVSSAGQAVNAKILSYATDAFGRLGLQFLTGGNGVPEERMRIDSSGNVSVLKTDSSTYSSTTPVADLILSRKNTDNANNETVGIRFDVTGWSGSTTGGAAIEAIQPSNASSADLAFLTRNAGTWGERMRIDSSGKVTIGTGIINPSIGGDIAITQGAIGLRINDAASAISATTATSNNDNTVDLGVSNIRFRNLYMGGNGTFGGNVGIGTTSSSTKLHISGNSNSSDNILALTNTKYGSTNTTGETGILFGWSNHSAARITAFKEGTVNRTGFKIIGEAGFNVPTTIATFRSTGYVGIGTTSPAATLDVDDDNTGKIRLLRNGSTRVELSNNANEGELSLYRSSTAKTIYISSYYNSYFNGGNVGIGLTAPVQKLNLSGHFGFTAGTAATDFTADIKRYGIGWQASSGGGNLSAFINSEQVGSWGGDLNFYTRGAGSGSLILGMNITSGGIVDIVGTVKSGGNQRFGAGPAHGNSSNPGITTKANDTAGVYWNTDGSGGWGGGNFTTNNSDRNMKTNIVPMNIDALKIIGSLETKYFNWTEKANKGDTSIRKAGIIAQDLKELMPEAVYGTEWSDEDKNTNGLALDENATTALLIKAIQELKEF